MKRMLAVLALFSAVGTGLFAQNYVVTRHTSVALPDAAADTILAGASTILKKVDGTGDLACNVTLSRSGPVQTFASPKNIDSAAAYAAVCAQPGQFHVVNSISWCAMTCPSCIGCSDKPGTCVTVVRDSDEDILWTHEYGHNKGLPDVSAANRVMNGIISSSNRQVTQAECDAYKATSVPRTTDRAAAPQSALSAVDFVRRRYIHGVPYAEAARYGAQDVPRLGQLLDDRSQELYWSNTAVTLGIIGDPSALPVLTKFVQSGDGKLSRDASAAKHAAVIALGYLYFKSKSGAALEYLTSGLDRATWNKLVHWMSPDAADASERDRRLVVSAIQGLALTGSEQAAAQLTRLRTSSTDADMKAVISDSLTQNAEVKAKGAAAFVAR